MHKSIFHPCSNIDYKLLSQIIVAGKTMNGAEPPKSYAGMCELSSILAIELLSE